jgi:transposase
LLFSFFFLEYLFILTNGKSNKYRNYSSQDLENAIKLVNSQTLSIRGASRRYNVPKSTIIDKLYGKSSLHSRSGPKSVLSETDENIIVEWLINMAKIGYGQTRQQLLSAVKKKSWIRMAVRLHLKTICQERIGFMPL